MYKSLKNIFIFILLSLVVVSCKYCSKKTTDLKIDLAYINTSNLCENNNSKLPQEAKELFKPIELNDNIGKFSGCIYQFGINPYSFISISDSNYNGIVKFRQKVLDEDTYDAVITNYNNMAEDISIESLCNGSPNNNPINSLNTILRINGYSQIFVLSKILNDTVWNNYRVYKNLNTLKSDLSLLYKASSKQKILVIIEPRSNEVRDTIQHVPEVQELLLLMGTDPDYAKRSEAKGKIIDTYFSNEFTITLRLDDSSTSVTHEYSDGIKYLDDLVKHRHLENIQIGNPQKDSQGKIIHLNVTEIIKKDIDVKSN